MKFIVLLLLLLLLLLFYCEINDLGLMNYHRSANKLGIVRYLQNGICSRRGRKKIFCFSGRHCRARYLYVTIHTEWDCFHTRTKNALALRAVRLTKIISTDDVFGSPKSLVSSVSWYGK